MIIMKIFLLNLIKFVKFEACIIIHCLWLVYKTVVYTAYFIAFLSQVLIFGLYDADLIHLKYLALA